MKRILENFESNILSRDALKSIIGKAGAEAWCGNGVTVACTGSSCVAANSAVGFLGGCSCWGPGGVDSKDCPQA
jgi:hypothetical protein